ncbi:MAG: Gfo/Idh/MocA family oxidoreductase [Planctomycetes bacterium]|nr:Gfo/Idh/MocA family oxidoreductase [Planctomycetota bacterium]
MNIGLVIEPTGAHLSSYLNALNGSPEATAVHVADVTGGTEGKVREVLGPKLAGFHRGVEEMLRAAQPTFCVVTLEAHHEPEVIRACLESGSHVLAEKPACARLEDFERVAALAKARGRQLLLAFANRLSPLAEDARRLVREGQLGRLYGVQVFSIADQTRVQGQGSHPNWFFRKDQAGGGHLAWLGIHWVDLLQYIACTPIVEVSAYAGVVGGTAVDVEDSATLIFRCGNGMCGSMVSGYYLNRSKQDFAAFWGERGWMWLRPAGENRLVWCSSDPAEKPPASQSISYEGRKSDGYATFVQAAIRAASGHGEFPLTTEESLRTLRVVFSAYESARTGLRVTIGS